MTTNRGLQTLLILVDHVRGCAGSDSVIERWHVRRRHELDRLFRKWISVPSVDSFVTEYSNSLASDVMRLMTASDYEGAAEALIEAVEDLSRQTMALARATPKTVAVDAPCLPGMESSAANNAMAA